MSANYEVRVKISIERILAIDIPSQTFAADYLSEASWVSTEESIHADNVETDYA